ncbi:MAG: hypothetical protein LBR26_13895 [Prevotella sp.]|nr:hypothetical protein [Prevotella sp.]
MRFFICLGLFSLYSGIVMAQKLVFRESQARLIEPKMNVYVKPLTVDLEIQKDPADATKGKKVSDIFTFTAKEVSAMGGDLAKIKAEALHLSVKKYEVDILVAATYYIKTQDKDDGVEVTITGYPATFKNWRTIDDKDYQWISTAYGVGMNETEKVKAITK